MAELKKEEEYATLYKQTGDKSYKTKAINEMRNLIYSTVQKINLTKSIDTNVLFVKGLGIAGQAVESWDPKKARLSTHVVSNLQQLTRTVYAFGPVLHVPEHTIKDFSHFKNVFAEYTATYGEDAPDVKELSTLSGLSEKKVEEFLLRERKTFGATSEEFHPVTFSRNDHRLDVDYLAQQFENDPDEKVVWEQISAAIKKEAPTPNASEIHKKIGGSYYKINTAYNSVINKLNKYILEN